MKIILDLGCGACKVKTSIGVDIKKLAPVDIVADIDASLPFKSDIADEIHLNHVIEHVINTIDFFKEIWRISKNGASIKIRVPHASSLYMTWSDPTHQRGFTLRSFKHYDPEFEYGYYSDFTFKIVKSRLNFFIYEGMRYPRNFFIKMIGKALEFFANLNEKCKFWCERYWGHLIGGFEELYVELVVRK